MAPGGAGGTLVTVTVIAVDPVQPAVDPVTVYVVVTDGLAATVFPDPEVLKFGFQLYDDAPEAVKITVPLLQIDGFAGVIVITGTVFTVRDEVAKPAQP